MSFQAAGFCWYFPFQADIIVWLEMTSPARDGRFRVPWLGGFTLVQWEEVGLMEENLGKILPGNTSKHKTIILKPTNTDWMDAAVHLPAISALSGFVEVRTITWSENLAEGPWTPPGGRPSGGGGRRRRGGGGGGGVCSTLRLDAPPVSLLLHLSSPEINTFYFHPSRRAFLHPPAHICGARRHLQRTFNVLHQLCSIDSK